MGCLAISTILLIPVVYVLGLVKFIDIFLILLREKLHVRVFFLPIASRDFMNIIFHYFCKIKVSMFAMLQVVDAYALIGDVSGLAEKIQSFFMQEVISETHSVLKIIVDEVCCNINVLAIQTINSGENT